MAYMIDLSALTDTELATLKTNLLASINNSASTAQSYAIGVRNLTRMNPKDAMELLVAVSAEIRQRATGGDDLILATFGDAE